jgi:1-acyl-sn-glycerol-3-phosphate acyltransferase
MLHFLPPLTLGCLTVSLMLINLLFWSVPVYLVIFAKLVIPLEKSRLFFGRIMVRFTECWTCGNNFIIWLTQKTNWITSGIDNLQRDAVYIVNSNHQTMLDILVLQKVLNRRVPFPRFFIKQQLIWVPVLGPIWWALDYPFMKRYSADYLEKHPEQRGKDLETTRLKCEKFKNIPVAIINFPEGSRFTPEKHLRQASPFQHLLLPKAGGSAFAIKAMGEKLKSILDVTIVYPNARPNFWQFLSGRLSKIIVHVEKIIVTPDFFHGDYQADPEFRRRFQAWITELWHQKDRLIDQILHEVNPEATADVPESLLSDNDSRYVHQKS